ncbi:MAG: winged helix-turn-helix transcriptional regulator [Gammaproteobacteria bacterium]
MTPDREEALTLEVLSAIDARSDLTQRHLADRLGVALGLANSYLRRCVRKGLVKITQAPANRYLYYLTPQGFAEKSRLTAQYLSASFDFYRRASAAMRQSFQHCEAAGFRRIAFAGISELAEVAHVRSHDFALDVVGIWAPGAARPAYLGKPVWQTLPADAVDAVVLTALEDSAALYAALVLDLAPDRIVVPELLIALIAPAGASTELPSAATAS